MSCDIVLKLFYKHFLQMFKLCFLINDRPTQAILDAFYNVTPALSDQCTMFDVIRKVEVDVERQ